MYSYAQFFYVVFQLEGAHTQGKSKLEERNQRLKTDLERWHINKKSDMKELIGGLAQRNIDTCDKVSSSFKLSTLYDRNSWQKLV